MNIGDSGLVIVNISNNNRSDGLLTCSLLILNIISVFTVPVPMPTHIRTMWILNLLRVNANDRAQPTLVVGLVSRVTRHPKRAEQDLVASVGNDSAVGERVG